MFISNSKKSGKLSFLVDSLLIILVIFVFLVGFYPQKVVTISSGKGSKAIYGGDRNGVNVSLMFNVYENTEVVNKILEVLEEENITATFFVGGCWADDNKQTLTRIINDGHELGNHGYFHKDHNKLNQEQNLKEIKTCHDIVKSLTGYDMKLFAPPSGAFSNTTLQVATSLGYKTIMWSKDTIDWRDSKKSLLVSRATKNIAGGDLILMHPKQHTLDSLKDIIKIIKSKGYNLVTVSECCNFVS